MDQPTNKKPTSKGSGFLAFLARPQVRIGLGIAELILAFAFVSWAINTGSLLDYSIAGLLTIIGVHDTIVGVKTWRRRK